MDYERIIRDTAKALLDLYRRDSTILNGINGPYDDPETRVRNLAHLIIIACIEMVSFGENDYASLIQKMGKELLGLRDNNTGLYCIRNKTGKDCCNGVIGHSWVIEALLYLWKSTHEQIYLDEAKRIAKKHEFNEKLGLWFIPSGKKEIDNTINHQIWFAASLFELQAVIHDDKLCNNLQIFMNKLQYNMSLSVNHKISHLVVKTGRFVTDIKRKLKFFVDQFKQILGKPSLSYKEEGYHLFNLFGLARIYLVNHDSFFLSKKFKRAMGYANSHLLLEGLISPKANDSSLNTSCFEQDEKAINIYGYPYNVPGFEILYVKAVFEGQIDDNISDECIEKQIELTYDQSRSFFGKMCHDRNTINYRIYEYYRYLEVVNKD